MRLSEILVTKEFIISDVDVSLPCKLSEIGFYPGNTIRVIGISTGGKYYKISIDGSVFAIQREVTDLIQIITV